MIIPNAVGITTDTNKVRSLRVQLVPLIAWVVFLSRGAPGKLRLSTVHVAEKNYCTPSYAFRDKIAQVKKI